MKKELKHPTAEQVLAAAKNHPNSRLILKELWPEAFESEIPFIKIGQMFKRTDYPKNVYAVVRRPKDYEVRIINISNGDFWDRSIKYENLKDKTLVDLSIAEFKELSGVVDIDRIKRLTFDTNENAYFIES